MTMRLDRRRFDDDRRTGDPLIDEECEAAREEVQQLAGRAEWNGEDPAMAPVSEAGGGVAEGFELAEARLVDAAEHGGRLRDPASDAFAAERETDRGGAVYGEADRERSSGRNDED
jgi:hypothetical protein